MDGDVLFEAFDLLAVLYLFFAIGVVVQLVRSGRATFDRRFTDRDRRLAGSATFYLVVPVAVALHELGHAAVTWLLGGRVEEWHYLFYWGYVVPGRDPALGGAEMAAIAAAGNLVSLLLGFGAIAWTVKQPISAAWNFVRLELARILLWLTLVIYPVGSLLLRGGDFMILREGLEAAAPMLGNTVIVLYLGFAYLVYRQWKGPWRARYLWLATPLYDQREVLRQRLEADPQNLAALRDLGRLHLAGNDAEGALAPLERLLARRPREPQAHMLSGLAHLAAGRPREASEHLRSAGSFLEERGVGAEQEDLYFEITLGLAMARLALGDAEGAIATAEEARRQKPSDLRALLMTADALVAGGKRDQARNRLEAGLDRAEGPLREEIRRRLRRL